MSYPLYSAVFFKAARSLTGQVQPCRLAMKSVPLLIRLMPDAETDPQLARRVLDNRLYLSALGEQRTSPGASRSCPSD